MNNSKLNENLLSYFLNSWIISYAGLYLYSDNTENNLETGNILLIGNKTEFKFSKFSSINKITKLNFENIFRKYNMFKINIINPLSIYFQGIETSLELDMDIHVKELNSLLNQYPLGQNDYRFQSVKYKLFNINTLKDACEILQILLGGSTVIYDKYRSVYRNYSSGINFYDINGLSNDIMDLNELYLLNNRNVYKTFDIV